jgi:glycine oxidase
LNAIVDSVSIAQKTIGIAGAGLAGRLLAWQLGCLGATILLFDQDEVTGQASCGYTGAGMLSPVAELDSAEPLVASLGIDSLRLWPQWLSRLPLPVYQGFSGTLVVAHQPDWPDLQRFKGNLHRALQHPVLGHYQQEPLMKDIRWELDRKAIQQISPGLNGSLQRGLFIPEEGQLDNRQLLVALEQALKASGVQWQAKTVVKSVSPGCITLADNSSIRVDWAIDTRGLGARSQAAPLRGVRGEIIRVHAPEVSLGCAVRVMHPRHPVYIAPRENHHYLIGATTLESDNRGAVTVQSAMELLSAAFSIHSGFAEASILELSSNCRPAFPDNLPKMAVASGFVALNGLYRHGFLMLPKLIELVLQYMETCEIEPAYQSLLQEASPSAMAEVC